MSNRSITPPETASRFSNLTLSSETADVGSSMDTKTMVSPPKLAEPSKSTEVPPSADSTVSYSSPKKTPQCPTASAGKPSYSTRPNLCRGKRGWIILLIFVIIVLIAIGLIVHFVPSSRSTTVTSTTKVPATQISPKEVPTSHLRTSEMPTRQISTTDVTTRQISTTDVTTRQITTVTTKRVSISSSTTASTAAPTTTQAPIPPYCTTLYLMNKQCNQTKITLRQATEAFFLLDTGIFNKGNACSGSFEINADRPGRVVLWTPLGNHFAGRCMCTQNLRGGCPATLIPKFKRNGRYWTSNECSKATGVSDSITVQYSFTKNVPETTVLLSRAIEAIKIKDHSVNCSIHKPFVKYCKIGKDNQSYCIHPDLPCLDGERCHYTFDGHVSCARGLDRVEFVIKKKGSEQLAFGGWQPLTYILPGNKMTLNMREGHSHTQAILSLRSADSRVKLSVESNRIHSERNCSIECARKKVTPDYQTDCASVVFVEASDTVVGARNTSTKLLCDPVESVFGNKTEILGSEVKISTFKRKNPKYEADISVTPICGRHCSAEKLEVQDCFGHY